MEPQFYLDPAQPDTVLPVFTAAEFFKYLGVDFNPFGRWRDQLTGARALLDRVCKAELKQQQKTELIRSHVLPRFLYTLTVGNPVSRAAAQIDALVRQAVKRILHLPVSLDVAIPLETQDALNRRHADKCRKYERLREAACKLTETKCLSTGAIVIGARGAWCPKNDLTLKNMNWNLTDNMKSFICLITLERTLQIINWFMRSSEQLSFRSQHRGRND
ncbi:hypothetical protein M514_24778 [Trichuris suis]|uniref:Reverse transcriptase domain-containing protein n=1 Tax=Trichuris suis TaxID=68888 RepID=A0A085N0L5_9BILA|nr:hypothetical protein M514_24778 [Trichuris suis]